MRASDKTCDASALGRAGSTPLPPFARTIPWEFELRIPVPQPAPLQGVLDEVGPALQAELLHRAGLVGLDRLDADVELGGDLLVAEAPGDQADDLGLALGQLAASAGPASDRRSM